MQEIQEILNKEGPEGIVFILQFKQKYKNFIWFFLSPINMIDIRIRVFKLSPPPFPRDKEENLLEVCSEAVLGTYQLGNRK